MEVTLQTDFALKRTCITHSLPLYSGEMENQCLHWRMSCISCNPIQQRDTFLYVDRLQVWLLLMGAARTIKWMCARLLDSKKRTVLSFQYFQARSHCDRYMSVIPGKAKWKDVRDRSLGKGNHAAERSYDKVKKMLRFSHRCKYFIMFHVHRAALIVDLKKNHVNIPVGIYLLFARMQIVSFLCKYTIAYTYENTCGRSLIDGSLASLSAMKWIYG